MKRLTDDEIKEMVYSQTHQETSREIEVFINGAIWYRDTTEEMTKTYEQDIINRD